MKKSLLFFGPVLFLIAQAILPEGNALADARAGIIARNSLAWDLGHQLIALALVFLVLWLVEVHQQAACGSEWLARLGLIFTAFAVLADYGIAMLQLQSSEMVRRGVEQWALPIMEFNAQDRNLMLLAYLPTLGFVPGLALLAVGIYRRTRQFAAPLLLALAGVLIAVAGLLQMKTLFIAGALALLAFTVFFVRARDWERHE